MIDVHAERSTARTALVLRAERAPRLCGTAPNHVYRDPRIAIEDRPLPALAPGSIRIAPMLVGLCGTDLHTVSCDTSGYVLGSAPLSVEPDGRVLGHEAVARVVALGAGVTGFEPGQFVTLESILRCHRCDACRRGRFNQCARSALLGMERDGVFATLADVPAELAHDVSDLARDAVGLSAAALIEPAACALRALWACQVGAGAEVAVFGAGPIGAFAAQLARVACGAGTVHLIEPQPFRRRLGARFADRCVGVEEFFAAPPTRGLDAVVEASGALENVDRVLPLTAPGARIALLARCGQPLHLAAVDHMITNDVALVGSRGHLGGAFSDVLRLVRAGKLRLADAVTHVVEGLDGLAAVLAAPQRVVAEQCKVLARVAAPDDRAG